jgi:hypothetical protein
MQHQAGNKIKTHTLPRKKVHLISTERKEKSKKNGLAGFLTSPLPL